MTSHALRMLARRLSPRPAVGSPVLTAHPIKRGARAAITGVVKNTAGTKIMYLTVTLAGTTTVAHVYKGMTFAVGQVTEIEIIGNRVIATGVTN